MLTGSNTNTVGNTFHHVIGIVLDKRNYIYKHGTFLTAALMKQTLEGPKTQLDALLPSHLFLIEHESEMDGVKHFSCY